MELPAGFIAQQPSVAEREWTKSKRLSYNLFKIRLSQLVIECRY
jgi:hypothetical protein